nr:hypothetical protein [Xenorhabdus mauleonii]
MNRVKKWRTENDLPLFKNQSKINKSNNRDIKSLLLFSPT